MQHNPLRARPIAACRRSGAAKKKHGFAKTGATWEKERGRKGARQDEPSRVPRSALPRNAHGNPNDNSDDRNAPLGTRLSREHVLHNNRARRKARAKT